MAINKKSDYYDLIVMAKIRLSTQFTKKITPEKASELIIKYFKEDVGEVYDIIDQEIYDVVSVVEVKKHE